MNAGEFNQRLLAQVKLIRQAERDYEAAIRDWAEAERLYKRAQAWAVVQVDDYRNAAERDAKAETLPLAGGGTINDLRYAAHLAEGLMNACKLGVQNRASELSALQSEASLSKAEAEFTRTAPHEAIGA